MKQGIHPEYRPVIFLDTSANHAFLTRSAIDTKGRETMKWRTARNIPW
jgi:large subunit ribosomal protein L31